MEIGENNLAAPQPAAFGAKRLLHFYDELRVRKDGFCAGENFCSGRCVFIVADTGPLAGAGLNQDLMAFRGQYLNGRRNQSNPIFIGFDFFRNTDQHTGGLSTLDADQWAQSRDAARKSRMLGGSNNRSDVLVGAGRLLGDATRRRASDENALRPQIVLDLASTPLLERRGA